MSQNSKPSYYAIIPAFVRYSKIEPNAKLLYGEITALCESEGYCFSTNEYFAELYDVKVRVVQNWLLSLKKIGAIKIDNPSNLDKDQQRKIWLCDDAKKMFTERRKMHGGVQKNASNTLSINTTTNNISPISPKGDSSFSEKRKRKTQVKVARTLEVQTTDSQHKALLKKANESQELVQSWYEKLSEWKIGKGMEGGNDFLQICKWVINAVEKEKVTKKIKPIESTSPYETPEAKANRVIAEKIIQVYNLRKEELERKVNIEIRDNAYIAFEYLSQEGLKQICMIQFYEKDFETIVKKRASNLGIKI